jgi:hypothetical protein
MASLGSSRLLGLVFAKLEEGQVVVTQHHVLGGVDHHFTIGRLEQVLAREHDLAGFLLGGVAQRHVDGHLVTVEVGVEGATDERVQLDGLTLDELGLEGLDTEAVQRRGAVEEHVLVG